MNNGNHDDKYISAVTQKAIWFCNINTNCKWFIIYCKYKSWSNYLKVIDGLENKDKKLIYLFTAEKYIHNCWKISVNIGG